MIVTRSPWLRLVIVHDQADMLEERLERFIFLHRARELGEVLEAAGAFGGAVGLKHRGVAAFVEEDAAQARDGGGSLAISRQRAMSATKLAEAAAGLGRELVAVEQVRGGEQQRLLRRAGVAVDGRDRLVAEPALGRVDDAFEREVVGRLDDQAEVGDGVADLGALVEAEAADDLVVEADRDEPLLELAGLELGADEDGDIVERAAARLVALDLLADAARFLRAVPDADDADLLAIAGVGPQRLAEPAGIVRDQAVGGGEDVRGRAVVLLQPDDLGAGEVLLERAGCWRPPRRARNRSTGRRRRRSRGCGCGSASRRSHSYWRAVGVLIFVDQDDSGSGRDRLRARRGACGR